MQGEPRRDVSGERQVAFYLGTALSVVGVLLFFSVLVEGALSFGDFTDFEERTRSSSIRALTGMGLAVIGGVLRGIGRAGLAGSGLALDPKRAREDLEPFRRQAGGMLRDALDEAELGAPTAIVKVRYRASRGLADETARFSPTCGAAL